MGKIFFASLFFVFFAGFASLVSASALDRVYANELVVRDCGQRQIALSNKPEFSEYLGKPVDLASISKILDAVVVLSQADPAAKGAPVTYMTCGEYILGGQDGRIFWRGLEVKAPAYLVDLETRNEMLQSRIFQLERDVAIQNEGISRTTSLYNLLIASSVILAFTIILLGHNWKKEARMGKEFFHIRHELKKLMGENGKKESKEMRAPPKKVPKK